MRELEKAFREHRIAKTYIACLEAEPQPPEGVLVHLLKVSKQSNKTIALPWSPDPAATGAAPGAASGPASDAASSAGSRAELSYRLILRSERYFFVEAEPRTGRHHQLRAQFAAIGCPIKGDLKYGSRRSCESGRIMLHARKLDFDHPRTKKRIDLEAPFPEDEALWQLLARPLE